MVDPIKQSVDAAANTVAKGAVSEVSSHPKTFLYVAVGAVVVVAAAVLYFVL